MNKPKLLDLFCGAGGCSIGYHRAGFHVTGVDKFYQPNYPLKFIQARATEFLRKHMGEFDVIHSSPPCQLFSKTQAIRKNKHPDYIQQMRDMMPASKPWVIENVPGSPLINPITLCGASFGLRTYRHRLFESNIHLWEPPHIEHRLPTTKMGRPPKEGEMMHIVGNFSDVKQGAKAMGIKWKMTSKEMSQAIPPDYTEWIGKQIMKYLSDRRMM